MKVLMLGDSPLMKTGFGRVQSHALAAFLRAGWEVATVTGLQKEELPTDLPVKQFVPNEYDQMGLLKAVEVFEKKLFEPDVVYATGEPGMVGAITQVVPARIPFYAYVPIEGGPIVNTDWRNILRAINFMTCSKYGADEVRQATGKEIDWVYHGVDTNVFTPLTDEERAAYRERLGWADKFVVVTVAQNVRRKQHPRLFEAMALLKGHYRQDDIILYDHTVPFQNYWLQGWNLPDIARAFGVNDEVVFNPLMGGFGKHVPERGDLEVPGLRELVASADLFVLPSQVEGFGLPIVEAMAVGTPVAVTRYAAGWEVAKHGMGVGIPVSDWEIAPAGTKYANVSPRDVAKTILDLKRDPKRRARMRAAGLQSVSTFDWSDFEEKVVAAVQKAAESSAPVHAGE